MIEAQPTRLPTIPSFPSVPFVKKNSSLRRMHRTFPCILNPPNTSLYLHVHFKQTTTTLSSPPQHIRSLRHIFRPQSTENHTSTTPSLNSLQQWNGHQPPVSVAAPSNPTVVNPQPYHPRVRIPSPKSTPSNLLLLHHQHRTPVIAAAFPSQAPTPTVNPPPSAPSYSCSGKSFCSTSMSLAGCSDLGGRHVCGFHGGAVQCAPAGTADEDCAELLHSCGWQGDGGASWAR